MTAALVRDEAPRASNPAEVVARGTLVVPTRSPSRMRTIVDTVVGVGAVVMLGKDAGS